MSRNYSPTARDVEKAYDRAKELLPGLGTLKRDERNDWYVGQVLIGSTAREANAMLRGMVLAIRFAGLAGAA